jgi:RHS repeat-associated protein
MGMPGRKFDAGSGYRYGFNGKENDNEVKGEGNQQDYGMRIYDPRLGRFLSVDPITRQYPELTPYQFTSNSPIACIDFDGEEKVWFMTRSYEHSAIFGTPILSAGDNRKASIDVSKTARIHMFIDVDLGTTSGTPVKNQFAFSSPTIQYEPYLGISRSKPNYDAKGNIDANIDKGNISVGSINFWYAGAHGVTKRDHIPTPDIDVHGAISYDMNYKQKTLSLTGHISGDAFPDAETAIFDESGQGIMLGEYYHKWFHSPLAMLPGNNDRDMIDFTVQIVFDENGNFKSAVGNKKEKDGTTTSTNLIIHSKAETNFDSSKSGKTETPPKTE